MSFPSRFFLAPMALAFDELIFRNHDICDDPL